MQTECYRIRFNVKADNNALALAERMNITVMTFLILFINDRMVRNRKRKTVDQNNYY